MKAIVRLARAALRHTRYVQSGSPPLYRLLVFGMFVSSVIQMFKGTGPVSVATVGAEWFDIAFMIGQAVSTVAILAGLYMIDENRYVPEKLNDSLNLEFIGLLILQALLIVNVTAVWFYSGVPNSPSIWCEIMFSAWAYTRLWDLRKTIKRLTTQ